MISFSFKDFVSTKTNNQLGFDEIKNVKINNEDWLFENNQSLGNCPKCGKSLIIRKRKSDGLEFIACTGFPRCTYTTGYNKNYNAPKPNAPSQGQQGQNTNPWYYADVISNLDNRFKQGEQVALRKINNETWEYTKLLSHNNGRVLASELRTLFKSILGKDNKQLSSFTPSIEDLRNLTGEQHFEKTTSEIDAKQYHLISDENISDEQKEIDQQFENMMKTGADHMMIDALAGTGKTTMLKHLAWKYGNLGQKWLYLVFNTKNKVEASEKFPRFVQVRTTNGFLGEVLANPNNLNKIPKTDRIVVLQNKKTDEENEKKLEKSRLIIDSPDFERIMTKFNLIDRFPDTLDIQNDYEFNGLKALMLMARFSYKEQVLTLSGLAKSFAIDPRKDNLTEELNKIIDDYDFDLNFDKVNERISEYKNEDYKERMLDLLSQIFKTNFENINFKDQIIEGTSWLLKQTMPGTSLQSYERGGKQYNLADYRDFTDDLWYSSVYSNNIVWPKYDVVLADEVQDFNEAQKIMLKKLSEQGARIVAVGDPNQCVIEGTLIETENGLIPIENISVGSNVLAGKGNGNKIISKVTDVYVKEVKKKLIKITTESGKTLTSTPEHTHFAGYETNKHDRYFVYLMYKENMGYRVGITRNYRSHINNGYKGRLNQERADKIWLIDQFETKSKAQIYEQYYSVKYGIPTVVFLRNSDQKYSQKDIDELYSKIDSESAALRLLNEKNMFINNPHHIPKCMNRKRYRNFNIILCGDGRGTGLHRYSIAGTDEIILDKNLKIRKAKNGWRAESSNMDLSKIYEIMKSISNDNEINVIEKARLTNITLPYMPASHVMEGMDIYISDGDKIKLDIVSKVETIDYEGKVYDINVDKFHNFIANGIVTHNSLYRFRGADSNSFNNIQSELEAQSNGKKIAKKLTSNFRSRKEILDFANEETHVKNLKAGKKFKDGKSGIVSKFQMSYTAPFETLSKEVSDGKLMETAFIARTNEPLIHAALKLLSNNVPFVILGKDIAKDLIKSLNDIIKKFKLKDTDPTRDLTLSVDKFVQEKNEKFGESIAKKEYLKELKEVSDAILATLDQFHSEKGGGNQYLSIGEYKKWINVKLGGFDIEESEKDYQNYKAKMEKEKPVVLTTAHRSKGLEFDRVFILRYDQFPHSKAKRDKDLVQEENARYVAITRAKDEVHILKLEGQPGYRKNQD